MDFYYEMCPTAQHPPLVRWSETTPLLLGLLISLHYCHWFLCTHIINYHGSNKMRKFRHEILMIVSVIWHSILLRSSWRQLHGATSEQCVPHTGSLWRLHRFNLDRVRRSRQGKGYCFSRWLSRSRNMILAPQGLNAQRGFGHWKTADSFTHRAESERERITVLFKINRHHFAHFE